MQRRQQLRNELLFRYEWLMGITLALLLTSLVPIVLFFVIYLSDESNYDPYHNLDSSGCPKPKEGTLQNITIEFMVLFFSAGVLLILIEIRDKLTRNIKYNLTNLIRQKTTSDDELDELTGKLDLFLKFKTKNYLGLVYLASFLVIY